LDLWVDGIDYVRLDGLGTIRRAKDKFGLIPLSFIMIMRKGKEGGRRRNSSLDTSSGIGKNGENGLFFTC
jgi:hypothetical protein